MLDSAPIGLAFLFLTLSIGSFLWFYFISKNKLVGITLLCWILIQSGMALAGLYQDNQMVPPRIAAFGVIPALLLIIATFLHPKGREWMDTLNLTQLTLFHAIRIPVEIGLYWAYTANLVPIDMTFEGYNYDIFSGISGLLIGLVMLKYKLPKWFLTIWNLGCLIFLFIIVGTALLTSKSTF